MSTGTFLPSFQSGLGFTSIHFRWRMLLSLMSSTHQEHNTHGTEAQIILIPPSAPPTALLPSLPAGSASTYCLRQEGTSWRPLNSSSISAGLGVGFGEQNSNISSLRKVPQHQLCAAPRASGQASWDQGRGDQPGKWHCRGKVRTAQHSCVGHVCLVAMFGWIRSFINAQQLYHEKPHCLEELLLLEA